MNRPKVPHVSSKPRLLKGELLAKRAATQAEISRLKAKLGQKQREFDDLQDKLAISSEEAELRQLEIRKAKWELFNLKAKWIFWPVTAVGVALMRLLNPAEAAATSRPPAAIQETTHSARTAAVPFSFMAKQNGPLNEPGWLSGRFHEKFRPFVDAVERLYNAMGEKAGIAEALKNLESTLMVVDAEKDVLDMAAAFAINALQSEEKRAQTTRQMSQPGKLILPPSFVSPSLPAQPLGALRQAAKQTIAGADIFVLRDQVALVSDHFLKLLPPQSPSMSSVLNFDPGRQQPIFPIASEPGS